MIKMTLDIKCTDKSRVQEEQLVGYLLRAIAGVTANKKIAQRYQHQTIL